MRSEEIPEELAVLLALDAVPLEEQADAELRHGTFAADLSDVTLALAEAVSASPPADLRAATLSRALSRRPAGTAFGTAQGCTALEAFTRTIDEFHALLRGLNDDEWALPAHDEHGTVHDLVAHLTGMERLCRAWLTGGPVPDPTVAHVEATRPVVEELASAAPAQLLATWRQDARTLALEAAQADPTREYSFHDMPVSRDLLLIIRTFELWAHGMDIALATGRPLPMLDPQRMLLMSSWFMKLLPFALAYGEAQVPGRTARFVLTGAGGGCYDVPLELDGTAGTPDVTIVTDVTALCRLAARRLAPDELETTIEGDVDLGQRVLAVAGVLARD